MEQGAIERPSRELIERKIRAIALTGDKRAPLLPDVQTFAEGGYADILGQWSAEIVINSPAEFGAFLRSEYQRIGALVKEQKIIAD